MARCGGPPDPGSRSLDQNHDWELRLCDDVFAHCPPVVFGHALRGPRRSWIQINIGAHEPNVSVRQPFVLALFLFGVNVQECFDKRRLHAE
jgi:hypothetical protein